MAGGSADTFAQLYALAPAEALKELLVSRKEASLEVRLAGARTAHLRRSPELLSAPAELLDRLATERERGRKIYLVSHAEPELAKAFAGAHPFFEEAVPLPEGETLSATAPSLVKRFGEGGFDLLDVDQIRPPAKSLSPLFRALRPHQWLKNLLVFLPLIAAHNGEPLAWFQGLAAFVCFCLVASSVYVLNDLHDLAADRAHPRKRGRPFASGELALGFGLLLAPSLLAAGLTLALLALPLEFLLLLLGYFGLTLAYSLWLKRVAVLDILLLSGLFTWRVLAGGAATGIVLSPWLLAFSTFLFFALAAVKRHVEIADAAERGEASQIMGRGYRTDDLPLIRTLSVTSGLLAVLVVALYVNSDQVVTLYRSPEALWLLCLLLLYWVTRIFLLAERRQMHDDPVVFAAKDPVTYLVALLGGAVMLLGSLA